MDAQGMRPVRFVAEQGMRPPRFRVLQSLTSIYVVIGWIVAAVGLVVALGASAGWLMGDAQMILLILPGLGTLVGGLLTVGFGELSQCFLAIEENTRKLAEDRAAGT